MKITDTLLLPLETGFIKTKDKDCLFLNAHAHAPLQKYGFSKIFAHTPYFSSHPNWGANNAFSNPEQKFDIALVLFPKNIIEAKGLIAHAIKSLRQGGVIICAGDNNAGGNRIKKILQSYGISSLYEETKNKARVVWGAVHTYEPLHVSAATEEAAPHKIQIDTTEYFSWPGIYGWNKIDTGSKLLAESISEPLLGHGADFGCGYGYLSMQILKNAQNNIFELSCFDYDSRALWACEKNLSFSSIKKNFIWSDLNKINHSNNNFDFVVMNPPFHDGKVTDTSIGVNFIIHAAQTIKKNGHLYLVANTQLPYEKTLSDNFSKTKIITQQNGFKVIHAIK